MSQPQVNNRIKKILWSDDEKRYLMKAAGTMPVSRIAHNLGRKEEAIRSQATKMGVSIKVKSHGQTE